MKLHFKIITFIFFFNFLNAQTYEKDWDGLLKKIDSPDGASLNELLTFEKKHQKRFSEFPDNSTQLYSLIASEYYNKNDIEKAGESYAASYKYAQKAKDTLLIYITELNLAYYYQGQDYLVEAEKFYEACMYGMSLIYGANSKEYTQVYYNYTKLLVDLEKYEKAKTKRRCTIVLL